MIQSVSVPRVPVPQAERALVEGDTHDPRFGAKNAYIIENCWGYQLDDQPAPPTWTPPPPQRLPLGQLPPPDPAREARACTFEQLEAQARAAGPPTVVKLPGMAEGITVYGARPVELAHLQHVLEAIPDNARDFLADVRSVSVGECEVFKGDDGSLSDNTTGCYDAGRLVLNRHQLDFFVNHLKPDAAPEAVAQAQAKDAEDWFNCIAHELTHVQDHHLKTISEAPGSPMGQGVWYTNYAWQTQAKPEDMAEGEAILDRQRWGLLHPGQMP